MRHYSEFLSTVSSDVQVRAQNEMKDSLKELNSFPTILCASTNSEDADVLKEKLEVSSDANEDKWY